MAYHLKISLIFAAVLVIFAAASPEMKPKLIVLTFDDGPRPAILKQLLPLLARHHIPGTFFVIGGEAENKKILLKEIAVQGHEIENHSYGHADLKILQKNKGTSNVLKDIHQAELVIQSATGQKPKFFRPPFWSCNAEIENALAQVGYTVMKLEHPDLNSLDYEDVEKKNPPSVLIERVKKIISQREKAGIFRHILVFHELQLSVNALTELILYFLDRGYQFVRLDNFPLDTKREKK